MQSYVTGKKCTKKRDELLFCLFNFFDFLVVVVKSLISSGSNASTHFHVETPSIQNAANLGLLNSLITFRHFYNKE